MPPTANTSASHAQSRQLIGALQQIRVKVRALVVSFGFGVALLCAVGALLGTVLLDWAFNLPALPRICIGLLGIAAFVYVVIRQIVRPLLSRQSISDIAGRLEHAFPAFDDRLRSTVDFVQTQIPGSEMMKGHVVREATQIADNVDLHSALVVRPVVQSVAGGLGALAVLVMLAIALPKYRDIAASRLLHPFGNAMWPKRVMFDAVKLPARVPLGQRIPITVHLSQGSKPGLEARIYYQYDDGTVEHDIMSRSDNGDYTASLDAKGSALKVWVEAGDNETQPRTIAVVPRLEIQHIEMEIVPPAYVEAGTVQTANLTAGPALMVAGSSLTLHVQFNKALDPKTPIKLEPAGDEFKGKMPAAIWTLGNDGQPAAHWLASESFRFHIVARDQDGFDNKAVEEYEIMVLPDQMPSVMIEYPRGDEEYTPVATVKMQIHAEDDFGIKTMRLIVDRDAGSATTHPSGVLNHWDIPLKNWTLMDSSGDRLRFKLDYPWSLADLPNADLKPGDTLRYYVAVTDNYDLPDPANPTGPHLVHPAVASGKLRINIISQEILATEIGQVFQAVANKTEDLVKSQNNIIVQNSQLKDDSKTKKEFDPGDKTNAERIAGQEATAASQTRQNVDTLEKAEERLLDNKSPQKDLIDLAHDVKNQLNDTSEGPMKQAIEELNNAKEQKADPKASPQNQQNAMNQRDNSLQKSGDDMKQASANLSRASERLQAGGLKKSMDAIQHDLDQQKQLEKETKEALDKTIGKRPEELTPEEKKKSDELAKEQRDLSAATDKIQQDMEKVSQQLQKSDPSASDAMKKAAEQAKSQGISQNQKQSADQAQQNQGSQTQSSQKQAELGLETVLNTLKQAEKEQLAKLSAKLDDLQKSVQVLVDRQSWHNYDNLILQNKPDKIDDELKKAAEKLVSTETAKPEVGSLSASQAQTESNTRDVAVKAGDLPDSTDIVSLLTRGAGKMVYAITSLRDEKLAQDERLANAYDPPQTVALASLKAALDLIKKQNEAAKKKIEDEQKEEIRQALIKVLDAQRAGVNKPTDSINGSPRLPDGSLERTQDIALKNLPTEQQKLIEKCKKIGEDLLSLKSIEFASANDEVIATMDKVKELLAKLKTGEATQSEELAIDVELTAMIDALKIDPDDKPYEEPKNGGGGAGSGGSGGAKVPSEVELKLMKARQLIVNNLTKLLNGKPDHEKVATQDLGARQFMLRQELDKMLKAIKIPGGAGDPPDAKEVENLPEMAGAEQVDDQELEETLLKGKNPTDDQMQKDYTLVGKRMWASGDLLQKDRPGQTTQIIQERIVKNLDQLIQIAHSQSKQSQGKPKPGEGEGQPQPGEQQANTEGKNKGQSKPNHSNQAAQQDTASNSDENAATLNPEELRKAQSMFQTSPRNIPPTIELKDEKVIDKFSNLVRDYYRSMSKDSGDSNK